MERLGDRIAESAAHLDAAMHRLLRDVREFDAGNGWHLQGAKSCAHWLSWRVGWDLGTARERVRVARRLGELPLFDAALARGEVSYSKLRAMTRVATPEIEATLLDYAQHAPAAQLETICRKYQLVQRLSGKQEAGDVERKVTRRSLDDGMVKIEATLRPEEATALWQAIDRAAKDVSAETLSRPDGLVALAQAFLRGDRPDRAPVELHVSVSAETLRGDDHEPAQLADGTFVPAATAQRLACDAGVIVDGGRKTRTIPTAIRRALTQRDQTCRFPGCCNRGFVDAHHIEHWARGGETTLGNLILLCTHHHAAVHELGVRIELDGAQRPTFYNHHGVRIDPVPARPMLKRDVWLAFEELHRELEITSDTNLVRWDGSAVDSDAAVSALL